MNRYRHTIQRENKNKLIMLSWAVLLMTICVYTMFVFAEEETEADVADGKTQVYLDVSEGDIVIGESEYILVDEKDDIEELGNLTETISYELDDGILTISGTGEMPDYNITYDETTDTYSSTSLSPFYGNEEIQRVIIDDGITKIGAYTFYNCPNLEGKITIPSTVTAIGDYAFSGNNYANAPKFTIIDNEATTSQEIGTGIFYTGDDVEYTSSQYDKDDKAYYKADYVAVYKVNDTNTAFVDYMTELYGNGYARFESYTTATKATISTSYFGNVDDITLANADQMYIPKNIDNVSNLFFLPSNSFDVMKSSTVTTKLNANSTTGDELLFEFQWFQNGVANSYYGNCFVGDGLIYDNANVGITGASKTGKTETEFAEKGSESTSTSTNSIGDDITYTIDDYGILTITGSGATYNYDLKENISPFYGNEDIKRVVIDEGITYIGDYLFYNCPYLEGLLEIPASVAEIGDYAFSGNSYANAPKFTQIYNYYEGEQTLGTDIFYALTDEETAYDYSTYDFVYVYNTVTASSQYVKKSSTYVSSTVRGLYSATDSNSNFDKIMEDLGYNKKTGEISWSSGTTSTNYAKSVTGLELNTTNKLVFYSYTENGNSYYFIPSTIFDVGLDCSTTTDPLTEIEFWQSVKLTNATYQSIVNGLYYGDNDITSISDANTVKRFFIGSTFINSVYLNSGATLGITKSGASNSNSIFSSTYDGTNAVIAELNIPDPDVTPIDPEVTDPVTDEGIPEVTVTDPDADPDATPTPEPTPTPEHEVDHWELENVYSGYEKQDDGSYVFVSNVAYDENTVFHIEQSEYDATSGEGAFTQYTITISGDVDVVVYLEGVNINTLGDEKITNSSGTEEITKASTTGRIGDAAILVENRADTILVIADETINNVQSNGNRAGIEKASASTNYDYELLDLDDWYELNAETQDIELEDGHLTIASESAYAAIVKAGDKAMITETETGQNILIDDDGLIVRDGVNPAYEEVTYDVEKYDYTIFENISTENDGTLNVTGGSNTNTEEGAGIGTRGVSGEDKIIVDVDLANLHIVGGNITSIAYGTHAGGAGIGTGSGRTSSDFDFGSSAKNFNIYAGNIEAGSTGAGAADIGGGFASSYAVINIYGGDIETMNITGEVLYEGNIENEKDSNRVWKFYASSRDIITVKRGAGIGGGGGGTATSPKAGATVNIYGGDITAYSDAGAAIGGGGGGSKSTAVGQDGTVNIYGGTIYAESSNGAAIGSGGSAGSGSAETGTVTIDGGDITAVIYPRYDELDKPEGYDDSTMIDLEGTGAAIGGAAGGTTGSGGDGIVTISGGTIYAFNNSLGSGIGGGGSIVQDGGDAYIEITGGTIYASSVEGTGIGGGVSTNGAGGDISSLIIRDDEASVFDEADVSIFSEDDGFYDYEGKTDEQIIEDRQYSTVIYATSIGGGNSSIGDGGDIEDFTIYNGFIDIGEFTLTTTVDDEEVETTYTGSGRIGGGKVTGDNSTGDGGSIGTYGDSGEVESNLEIMGGFIQATSIGGGDVEGSNSKGDGGEIAGVRLHGGIILVEQHIGGGNVTGNGSSGDGGDITNLYINEKGDSAGTDEEETNFVNTLIYTGSIGGGNVTGDNSSGDGGDIVTVDIQYATFNVIGYIDDEGMEQVGHIGGGNVTGAYATGNGGDVGTYEDATGLYSNGVTVHCGVVNAYSIGGGSVTDETSNGTGGFANVIIEAGFTTVEENIGGGNATINVAGDGKVTTYGGTTVAGLIGSGFSLKYGYAEAAIHFHGGSINSQVSTTVYTGGEEYSELLGDLTGDTSTDEQDEVYDHDITLDDETASETDYLLEETEVFLTRICYYNTDVQKYELFIETFTASYLYNGTTYIRTYELEDVVTGSNGYIYLWLPEGAIITSTETLDYNTKKGITYDGAIQSKSVDALKYNCSKNYYGVTFPYTTRVTFYSDAECTMEFSGKYAGIITTPYGATLEFWAQTELEENDFYDLLAYRSTVSGGTSEYLALSAQSDSDPETGYYHYILTITTDTEMLFQTIAENGDNRMAVDLSSVYAEITDNSVTTNGFILGGGEEVEETASHGSIFLTSSGLPTANEISFTGSDDKTFYVTLDRMVADNDDSIITINSGTVDLEYGEFDNSITANADSDYPAISVEDGATLNLSGSSTSSLSIASEADGVPAIGSSGTVNITDNGFLEILSPKGTADIVSESFTYTTSDLTGSFTIDYEPTIGTLLGYYTDTDSDSDRLYALDYEYDITEETTFIATTCRVVPTSTTYNLDGDTGESEFVITDDGDLIFENVQYDGKNVVIEHVAVMRDGEYLVPGEEFDYTVDEENNETNITIFSQAVYGNLTVLVKFTGELLYDANDYQTQYNDKDQYFPFELIDPEDGTEVIEYEDGTTVIYDTDVEVYYASSSVLYEQNEEDGLYYVLNDDGSKTLINDDGYIVITNEEGITIITTAEQVLEWNQYDVGADIAEFTMKNVGIRYIYVKVETQITTTDVEGNEIKGEEITKYTTPFSFEITEGVNRWQSALTCVSVVVDQDLTYSATAKWGDNENVLYTFSYYDPDMKLLQDLPYTPAGETYTGQLITDDISENMAAYYLTNFPGRYGITSTQPASIVYAEGTTIDNVDVSGQAIVDDEGNPYYGVYVGKDDKIYYTQITTDENGTVTEETVEIENAVMNYPEIISEVVLFDVQKTKVTVLDDKDLSQLDLREDAEILPDTYNIGSSREATILVDFQYAPRDDETLYIVTSELPDGTKITLLDITDYDPETPADDPDPSFYYYVIGEDYTSENGYEGSDEEIIKCEDVTIYDEDGDGTTYTDLTMIPSTIMKEMGTYDTVDYDASYWYYDTQEYDEYATNRVRYQICIEFPEDTDAGDYYFELRQGVEAYFDNDDVNDDAEEGDDSLSNVEATIVDSGFVLALEDEIGDPKLDVEDPTTERETITTTITTSIDGLSGLTLSNALADDVLAVQLYVDISEDGDEEQLIKFDFPTGAVITLDEEEASSVRGGFAVFTNVTGGEQEVVITGLEEDTYQLVFYLCTDVENESYPMSDCTYTASTRVDTDITSVADPIYSVYAELDADDEFIADDSRAIDSEIGAVLTFNVSYAVENTPVDDDALTITIQKKNEAGVYEDIDTWDIVGIEEVMLTQADEENGIEANLEDEQSITVMVPSGLDPGTYRINFNLDYQTYPYNIIVY